MTFRGFFKEENRVRKSEIIENLLQNILLKTIKKKDPSKNIPHKYKSQEKQFTMKSRKYQFRKLVNTKKFL
jgi:hypothetical protein